MDGNGNRILLESIPISITIFRGTVAHFGYQNTGGSISIVLWSFDDGATAATYDTATHIFSTFGNKSVRLTANGPDASTAVSMNIHVFEPAPEVAIKLSDSVVTINRPVTFSYVNVGGQIDSVRWEVWIGCKGEERGLSRTIISVQSGISPDGIDRYRMPKSIGDSS